MKRRICALLIAVFILPLSAGTREQEAQKAVRDGNFLLPTCKAAVRFSDGEKLDYESAGIALSCQSYIIGFIEGYTLAKSMGESKTLKPSYCPSPTGTDTSQAVRIVTKWLSDNPDKLHIRADMLVLAAMSKAFPCPGWSAQ
ncbi:MAG: hypothetical protein HY234_10145 [Acidobacteria bacterium]|nr:hypothetical protein [Acidobacteriota bacterium]